MYWLKFRGLQTKYFVEKAGEFSPLNIRPGPTPKSITPLTFRFRLFRLRMVLLYSLLKLDQKWHWRILVAILARSVKSSVWTGENFQTHKNGNTILVLKLFARQMRMLNVKKWRRCWSAMRFLYLHVDGATPAIINLTQLKNWLNIPNSMPTVIA